MMGDDLTMQFPFDGIDDMPRALRSAAVITPVGQTGSLKLQAKTMLQLAHRIEDGRVYFVVVEVDKPKSGLDAIFYAMVISVWLYAWVYAFIPAMARIILRWLA